MKKNITRREFMALVAGTSAALMSSRGFGNPPPAETVVPKRAFGNTGVKISKLCLGGGSFTGTDSQALLDEALKYGVDCWEIVSFTGKAYSDYFKKHPDIREKVFLSGKVYSTDPNVMQQQLDKTLSDNGTSMIDFLAVHVLDNLGALTNDVRKWTEKAKQQKKIRFFGFCTHRNMSKCLSEGAELGWIDGIQTAYNYRLQGSKRTEDALQKCHEKGIGIFAVKSMGLTVQQKAKLQKLPLNEEKLNSLLAVHNMSFEQAKMKAIWQNSNVTSACSLMPNSTLLQSNSIAATDEQPLNAEIKKLLADYSESTKQYFCIRCGLCDKVNADKIPIFDIMDMLMYSRGYGLKDLAIKRFEQIPIDIRSMITSSDYSGAERICPPKMPIAQLMKEAYTELSK
jgi:uncharacterized protein